MCGPHSAKLSRDTWLIVTAGARGSWWWDGDAVAHLPVLTVPGRGHGRGRGCAPGRDPGRVGGRAAAGGGAWLGVLTAAVAVKSPHTINFELDRAALRVCAEASGVPLAMGADITGR